MDTPLPQREPGRTYRDAASLDETQEIDMRSLIIDTWPIDTDKDAREFIDFVQEGPNGKRT